MEHKKVTDRPAGAAHWKIRCSCGRVWVGWRLLVEENFIDHVPLPEEEPVYPRWHDTESYLRYQGGGDTHMDEADNIQTAMVWKR